MINRRKRAAAVAAGATLAAVASLYGAANQAHADSYIVKNDAHSVTSINIYNHQGCMGATTHLYPGQESNPFHDWHTFWLPKFDKALLENMDTGDWHEIDNTRDYRTCHSIGAHFSLAGWRIKIIHND